MQNLPSHLKKYIVEQDYSRYTAIDQACWRYILRQLKSYLAVHAHDSYLDGLEKTGITTESIPRISEISKSLEKFGWRALPVSGFIPPAAFMELQSLGVLPIASDMRSLNHLMYTPAPDIVHEAAGHAPILINKEFSDYLKQYAEVARKAIISSEDLAVYECIRDLSDLKENSSSTEQDITNAQKKLDAVIKQVSHVSEAAELSRMNWWTAEYGLVGDMNAPQIYGAGLLSSVGESQWCLSSQVKKIPLTVECIKQSYDITEPQPQLFVTPDFKHLGKVLNEMVEDMAFRVGGQIGLEKAIQAKTVNTVELDSGLQISGQFVKYKVDSKKNISYVKTEGPTQLSFMGKEISGHGINYHSQGFSTILGPLLGLRRCISQMSQADLVASGILKGKTCDLKLESGIQLTGTLTNILWNHGFPLILSFVDCDVSWNEELLFSKNWGNFDWAVGSQIVSVFGGPADREAFGNMGDDFVVKKVPQLQKTDEQLQLLSLYEGIRTTREKKCGGTELEKILTETFQVLRLKFSNDWLLPLEIYELALSRLMETGLHQEILIYLSRLEKSQNQTAELIQNGVKLVQSQV